MDDACVCVGGGNGARMCMCDQGTTKRVGSSLIPCASEGQSWGHQACWQVLLPTAPLDIFPSSLFVHFITIKVLCECATNIAHETTVINSPSSFFFVGGQQMWWKIWEHLDSPWAATYSLVVIWRFPVLKMRKEHGEISWPPLPLNFYESMTKGSYYEQCS